MMESETDLTRVNIVLRGGSMLIAVAKDGGWIDAEDALWEINRLRSLIVCGTCGDEYTSDDRGTCGNCLAGETAALHVEIERLTSERDALRAELAALRAQESVASGGPTIVVELTDEQRAYVRGLLPDMPEGGACFAQVYGDAMRVRTFDVATTRRVAASIGLTTGAEGLHTSAYEAQEAAMTAATLN